MREFFYFRFREVETKKKNVPVSQIIIDSIDKRERDWKPYIIVIRDTLFSLSSSVPDLACD